MRFYFKIVRGATKKEVAKLQSEAWGQGFDFATKAFHDEYQRRLASLKKDGITQMKIQDLQTWYKKGK